MDRWNVDIENDDNQRSWDDYDWRDNEPDGEPWRVDHSIIATATDSELYLLSRHGDSAKIRKLAAEEIEARAEKGDAPGEGNPAQWR